MSTVLVVAAAASSRRERGGTKKIDKNKWAAKRNHFYSVIFYFIFLPTINLSKFGWKQSLLLCIRNYCIFYILTCVCGGCAASLLCKEWCFACVHPRRCCALYAPPPMACSSQMESAQQQNAAGASSSTAMGRTVRISAEGVGGRVIRGVDWKWGKQVSSSYSAICCQLFSLRPTNTVVHVGWRRGTCGHGTKF